MFRLMNIFNILRNNFFANKKKADIPPEPPSMSRAERNKEWALLKTNVEATKKQPVGGSHQNQPKGTPRLSPSEIVRANIASGRIKGKVNGLTNPSKMNFRPKTNTTCKYPALTMSMIDSNGSAISSTQAVKFFKDFALSIGYLQKDELDSHASFFSEEIKAQAECLKDDLAYAKECASDDVSDARKVVLALQKRLKKCKTSADIDQTTADLAEAKESLDDALYETNEAQEALNSFNADKRHFLIQYVNSQTQGQG